MGHPIIARLRRVTLFPYNLSRVRLAPRSAERHQCGDGISLQPSGRAPAGRSRRRAAALRYRLIGYLAGGGSEGSLPQLPLPSAEGCPNRGYVDGRNVTILRAVGRNPERERLPALAAELVRRQVALIFATGGTAGGWPQRQQPTPLRLYFHMGSAPVGALGLVASLNHPGGNATGATFLTEQLAAKRIELLHESVPSVRDGSGYLTNPTGPLADGATKGERRGGQRGILWTGV